MRRICRFEVALVAAVITAGAASLAVEPGGLTEDARGPVYRLCNVAIPMPPDEFLVFALEEGKGSGGDGRLVLIVRTREERRVDDPASDYVRYRASQVAIDARTGEVISRSYATASDEMTLEGLVARRQVQPFGAGGVFWPYGDRFQLVPERETWGVIGYRPPDPGAGLALWEVTDSYGGALLVKNCRSEVWVVGEVSGAMRVELSVPLRNVHPQDENAFRRFLEEVSLHQPER